MPSTEKVLHAETVIASGAIKANRLVKHDGAQATTKGEKVLGSARNNAASGEAVAVAAIGVAIIAAGAAVAVGDDVISDARGRVIKKTGASPYVVGVARSVGAFNGTVEILLK